MIQSIVFYEKLYNHIHHECNFDQLIFFTSPSHHERLTSGRTNSSLTILLRMVMKFWILTADLENLAEPPSSQFFKLLYHDSKNFEMETHYTNF